MSLQNSPQWNFGRFIKTLSYFGAVPILSDFDWFQRWFGSHPHPKVNRTNLISDQVISGPANSPDLSDQNLLSVESAKPRAVLLISTTGPLSQRIAHYLSEQEYEVRSRSLLDPVGRNDLSDSTAVICETVDSAESPPTVNLEKFIEVINGRGLIHQVLFDFSQPPHTLQEIWGALDDVVMGGVSQSRIEFNQSTALFSGEVSTANSGGFASVRTRNFDPPLDLSNYQGIELNVRGDGQRYKFMLRSETRWDGVAHCYSFDTLPETSMTIRIPFATFIPVFRAKTMPNVPLQLNQISAFQLMLSKFEYDGDLNPHFQPGHFQLQVNAIRAYRQVDRPKLILISSTHTPHRIEQQLQQSHIPYLIIYVNTLVDGSSDHRLQAIDGKVPTGSIHRDDLAQFCVQALNYSQARNRTITLTMSETGATLENWANLLTPPSLQ